MTKRVTGGFSVWVDGVPRVYPAGELVADDDPILGTHRHLFADVATLTRSARGVETATAEPGQPRTLTTPPAPPVGAQTPADAPPAAPPYDPGSDTVKGVLAHLDGVEDEAEARRVLDAEQDGQKRAGILGKRDEILARYTN
jgi:hypothetical protein